MGIEVSLGISPRESLEDWRRFAAVLDGRGVERLWLIDSQLAMKDVYVGLAAAAMASTSMRLGTGVTNVLTRHPTVTAASIAAVSELSGGRAVLGIGAGDSAVQGIGLRPSRVAEVEEALRFFRAVFAGEPATWQGTTYRLPHAAAPVPLYLAVSRPRMCRLAGRLADGAILMGAAQPELVAEQVGWLGEGLAEAGRDRASFDIRFVATTSAREDAAAALDDVRSWASAQARLLADVDPLPESLQRFGDELVRAKETYDFSAHLSTRAGHQGSVSDELVRTLAVAGSPAECVSRLAALRTTGVDDFIFPLMGSDRLERLRMLAEHVAPAVTAAA
jgi:5,10-methylenetetrahydromethanopterin reductase